MCVPGPFSKSASQSGIPLLQQKKGKKGKPRTNAAHKPKLKAQLRYNSIPENPPPALWATQQVIGAGAGAAWAVFPMRNPGVPPGDHSAWKLALGTGRNGTRGTVGGAAAAGGSPRQGEASRTDRRAGRPTTPRLTGRGPTPNLHQAILSNDVKACGLRLRSCGFRSNRNGHFGTRSFVWLLPGANRYSQVSLDLSHLARARFRLQSGLRNVPCPNGEAGATNSSSFPSGNQLHYFFAMAPCM